MRGAKRKRLPTASRIRSELKSLSDPAKAAFQQRYFRAVPGGYGEGDRFLGIRVPDLRRTARGYRGIAALEDLHDLIQDPYHEVRLTALLLLSDSYSRSRSREEKEAIYRFYLDHTKWINNWDLVDTSAPLIVGAHLLDKPREILLELALSRNLWEQRIALLATLGFIRNGDFQTTLTIVETLLHHPHDLIHKAAGWMLREIGNRSPETEIRFLTEHRKSMPRTMLRYATEKFDPEMKKRFL